MGYKDRIEIEELLGKVFTKVEKIGEDEIIFTVSEDEAYKMFHNQDCCEGVSIDDIEGDLSDLIHSPILQAEEVNTDEYSKAHLDKFNFKSDYGSDVDQNGNYKPESCTWTFYKLATIKGYVTIRWYGESNGYYSESVDIERI